MRAATERVGVGLLLIGLLSAVGAEAQQGGPNSSPASPNAGPQKAVSINEIDVGPGLTATGASFSTGFTGPKVTLGLAAIGDLNITGAYKIGGIPFLYGVGTGVNLNTFVGPSGNPATTGFQNVALGTQALFGVTSGITNTAIGAGALTSATIGGGNTAVGAATLVNYTGNFTCDGFPCTVHNNTAIGSSALLNNTGGGNTAVGALALQGNTTGLGNTALGISAGFPTGVGFFVNDTGSYNTFLGNNSGFGAAGPFTNATAIGANAVVSQSNSLVLGSISNPVNVGIGTATPVTPLQVVGNIRVGTGGTDNGCIQGFNGTAIAGTCSSDLRFKKNIQTYSPVLTKLVQLQPVTYDWRVEEFPEYHFGHGRNIGLIAQDVERVFPELVSTDKRGFEQVNYSELPYLMLQAIRELKAERDSLAEAVQKDEGQIRVLSQDKDQQIWQLKEELDRQQAQMLELREEMATFRATQEQSSGVAVASASH